MNKMVTRRQSPVWLWSGAEASEALRTRDLAVVLRTYRRLTKVSQERLAAVLGYDKTYISMIENRRRTITDVSTLRHIADTLAIPVHALGVTDAQDATFVAMLQFADSVLALADTARQSGHAVAAINELWPLVARLEARAAEGLIERDTLNVLGRARLSLGLALGNVLPDERLATAAKWTGRALAATELLDDQEHVAHVLAMHGNELRKAGHVRPSIARAQQSLEIARDVKARASAYAILARAAGESGHADLFDFAIAAYREHLEMSSNTGMLVNPFTFREILLRGLVATGRASRAARLLTPLSNAHVAPQWAVIEQITVGEVLLATGDRAEAETHLLSGLTGAKTYQLPHQVQRAVRVATAHQLDNVAQQGRALLTRLRHDLMAIP